MLDNDNLHFKIKKKLASYYAYLECKPVDENPKIV